MRLGDVDYHVEDRSNNDRLFQNCGGAFTKLLTEIKNLVEKNQIAIKDAKIAIALNRIDFYLDELFLETKPPLSEIDHIKYALRRKRLRLAIDTALLLLSTLYPLNDLIEE